MIGSVAICIFNFKLGLRMGLDYITLIFRIPSLTVLTSQVICMLLSLTMVRNYLESILSILMQISLLYYARTSESQQTRMRY